MLIKLSYFFQEFIKCTVQKKILFVFVGPAELSHGRYMQNGVIFCHEHCDPD